MQLQAHVTTIRYKEFAEFLDSVFLTRSALVILFRNSHLFSAVKQFRARDDLL